MAKEKPICEQAVQFTKFHHGKNCFAPCTGQDYRVFHAFAHLVNAWCAADDDGRTELEIAMYHCTQAVQPKIVPLLKLAAVAAADWVMVDELFVRLNAMHQGVRKLRHNFHCRDCGVGAYIKVIKGRPLSTTGARRKMRDAGWSFTERTGKLRCPKCKKRFKGKQ